MEVVDTPAAKSVERTARVLGEIRTKLERGTAKPSRLEALRAQLIVQGRALARKASKAQDL